MIFDFLKQKHECTHDKIPIDVDEAYCPDCGELIKNKWYIVRCSCCGIKRKSHTEFKTVKPNTKYCPNCGSTEVHIEELEKLSFIDVPYAILKRVVVKRTCRETHQIWVEKDEKLMLTSS